MNADSDITVSGKRVALTHEHRGGIAPDTTSLRPDSTWLARIGGADKVDQLIDTLYERIQHDEQLRRVFPHFENGVVKQFFVEWLGGPRGYSNSPWFPDGVDRFHQKVHITPSLAMKWVEHFQVSLTTHSVNEEMSVELIQRLRPIALALANALDPPADAEELVGNCNGVQTREFLERDKLRSAAASGRFETVRKACQAAPELAYWRGLHGRSLLWEAASRGRTKLVEYLVDLGANPNYPGCEPAVFNLACSGKAGIGTGVMVTPWTLALDRDHVKVARILQANGARLDVFSAAFVGDIELLQAIVSADPRLLNAEDPADDFKRVTPLHHAIAGGQADAADWLIAQGAEVRAHSTWLLTHAALQNREDLVSLLLRHQADVSRCTVLGPLDAKQRPVADILVQHGYDINANPAYQAMLVRACRGDVSHHETTRVEALLQYGADVNRRDQTGLAPLHYAVRAGRIPLIQLLLDHGANIHAKDDNGLTPWDHLRKSRSKADPLPVLQILLDHGFDVNHQTASGETILFFYARRGEQRLVGWLQEHGADPTLRNQAGKVAADFMRSK